MKKSKKSTLEADVGNWDAAFPKTGRFRRMYRERDIYKSQAEFEFNGLTSVWKVVPEKTNNVLLFGFED
jgi:hypothetical protein